MHFRHRQTDTDIVAQARDVYITRRAENCLNLTLTLIQNPNPNPSPTRHPQIRTFAFNRRRDAKTRDGASTAGGCPAGRLVQISMVAAVSYRPPAMAAERLPSEKKTTAARRETRAPPADT